MKTKKWPIKVDKADAMYRFNGENHFLYDTVSVEKNGYVTITKIEDRSSEYIDCVISKDTILGIIEVYKKEGLI